MKTLKPSNPPSKAWIGSYPNISFSKYFKLNLLIYGGLDTTKSYLLDEKGSGENTAMGKLVSITLSAAIDLMLQNKFQSGVVAAPKNYEFIDYYFSVLKENNINILKDV